ncbi:hypothetical protein KP509_22G078900 [Ceratopteris richardii]|nr:hypothetical protein KP509_22G078900 [Ceratopteris richardii]
MGGLSNCNLKENDVGLLKLQYISLRDLIMAVPTKKGSSLNMKELEWCDPLQVKFKDELLKQAARAYLQPKGKKTVPKVRFFENVWKRLLSRNSSFMESSKDYLLDCVRTCVEFLRTQMVVVVERLKPCYLRLLPGLKRRQLS